MVGHKHAGGRERDDHRQRDRPVVANDEPIKKSRRTHDRRDDQSNLDGLQRRLMDPAALQPDVGGRGEAVYDEKKDDVEITLRPAHAKALQ
jgi:hypothetical protein